MTKRTSYFLLLASYLFLSLATSRAQVPASFEGRWWLGIIEGTMLPINLTFGQTNGGEPGLVPFLYSPLQTSESMVASEWSFSNDTLRFIHNATKARLTLKWNASDNSFSGTIKQGYMRSAIQMTPSDGIFEMRRPQTPQPPFPYSESEVTILRNDDDVTIAGTLTIPEGNGPFPAVVLVSGSGQQNRDEEIFSHKPFLVLADHLARNGIAVLRYDDRGMGGSRGDLQNATTLDFADDAEAVFNHLLKQQKIDTRRVGIIGHSEGALIADIIAARNSKVAFIVTLGGQAGNGRDILVQQNRELYQRMGLSKKLVDLRVDCLRSIIDTALSVPTEKLEKTIISILENKCSNISKEERKQLSLTRGDASVWSSQMQTPWMKTFLTLDAASYLRKVRCPILAIGGENDCQVPADNLKVIARITGKKAETHLMPKLNHLLQHSDSGLPKEYMLIEETISPEVLSIISQFVKKM